MLTPNLKNKILSIVDDYTIYSHYISDLVVGSVMRSPLRCERKPSFIVRYGSHDNLYHKDYGDEDYYGDCFKFVMQKYDITYQQALIKVDQDLGLGISKGEPVETYEKSERPIKDTKPKRIDVTTKEFTDREYSWWADFGITKEDLLRENIFSVDSFTMENDSRVMRPMYKGRSELCFAYKFFDIEGAHIGWKVYFPNRKDFKWFSSVPNNIIEGLDNIKNFRRLIITKSRKDRIVLSKILPNVISSQNESRGFLTEEYKELFSNFKEVYIWFDSDEPGVKACKRITQEMGWKYVNTPKHLIPFGVKDPAEWRKRKQSYTPIISFLKKKQILP